MAWSSNSATPQEIYDRPASMFVAGFIGSPPMNFLRLARARSSVAIGRLRSRSARCRFRNCARTLRDGEIALGVRPEHVVLRDASPLRGQVFGTEYLGTTQIVTVTTRARTREGARFRPRRRCARASRWA